MQSDTKGDNKKDIESQTIFLNPKNLEEMILEDINLVHRDSVCSLYLNNSLGIPTLYYIYKDSLSDTQKTDRVFVHLFLKDDSGLTDRSSIVLGYDFNPFKVKINSSDYFVFKAQLLDKDFELQNLEHINTGRYNSLTGQRSYQAEGIKVNKIRPLDINKVNDFERIIIALKKKDFDKLAKKREDALEIGVLTSDDDDLVKASLSSKISKNLKGEIRLKGDWTDHLNDLDKWSFRIKLDDESTFMGMGKFSIQHPKVRNYLWEWLFNKTMKENGLIGLRYDFLNVRLQINSKDTTTHKDIGIMAIEESFDKLLIENNKRREGIILSFDESFLWNDRAKLQTLGLADSLSSRTIQSLDNAPIRVFNENKVLASPVLSEQFKMAKNLLNELRKGNLKISEVFDIDKLTLFTAISNVFGGHHGLVWHNLRIYYNPVTNKLEPISFDSDSGHKIDHLENYIFSDNDRLYQQKMLEKLEYVSGNKFMETLLNYEELQKLALNLQSEFKMDLDLTVLEHNINFIKKQINPSNAIVSYLHGHSNEQMTVDIQNISEFPVVIKNLQFKNGKLLSKSLPKENIIYPLQRMKVSFPLKKAFLNAFVSKKNKKGEFRYPKDLAKINLNYELLGSKQSRFDIIIPYSREDENFVDSYTNKFLSFDLDSNEFLSIDHESKTIRLKKGSYIIDNTIRIPDGYTVRAEKGFNLDLRNNASFISFSTVILLGTKEEPINFYSSDSTGGGIFISGAGQKSIVTYSNFTNLANPIVSNWSLTGAVNFNESEVSISNSSFKDNRSEDGLNIIRSNFQIDFSFFSNTQSDAFDGDFVMGKITNTKFLNCGNDGIDVSGSTLEIQGIEISGFADKAISIGEGSSLNGKNINIHDGEIGIVSKDLSAVQLTDVVLTKTRLGISCFKKKSEYGPASINLNTIALVNNDLDFLIEEQSELWIDNVPMETKKTKVIEKMYGKEYGKSSK